MAWNLDSDRPIYAQLLERIQLQIVSAPMDRVINFPVSGNWPLKPA